MVWVSNEDGRWNRHFINNQVECHRSTLSPQIIKDESTTTLRRRAGLWERRRSVVLQWVGELVFKENTNEWIHDAVNPGND